MQPLAERSHIPGLWNLAPALCKAQEGAGQTFPSGWARSRAQLPPHRLSVSVQAVLGMWVCEILLSLATQMCCGGDWAACIYGAELHPGAKCGFAEA